jgi:hypothetical protein
MTYGRALIKLLIEPLIHITGAHAMLNFAHGPTTPLTGLFNRISQSTINVVEHKWPEDRTMADVGKALENAFAGRGEKSQEILQQVKGLIACNEHHFTRLNWPQFTGSVHCEAIVAVDLFKHVSDLILIDKH